MADNETRDQKPQQGEMRSVIYAYPRPLFSDK